MVKITVGEIQIEMTALELNLVLPRLLALRGGESPIKIQQELQPAQGLSVKMSAQIPSPVGISAKPVSENVTESENVSLMRTATPETKRFAPKTSPQTILTRCARCGGQFPKKAFKINSRRISDKCKECRNQLQVENAQKRLELGKDYKREYLTKTIRNLNSQQNSAPPDATPWEEIKPAQHTEPAQQARQSEPPESLAISEPERKPRPTSTLPADLSSFTVKQLAPGEGGSLNFEDPRNTRIIQKSQCRVCRKTKPVQQLDGGICYTCADSGAYVPASVGEGFFS